VLRLSADRWSVDASASAAWNRSSEIVNCHFAITGFTRSVKRFDFSSVMLGKRTFVTASWSMATCRASRSVCARAVNQMTPNTGAVPPFRIAATAARPVSMIPRSESSCG